MEIGVYAHSKNHGSVEDRKVAHDFEHGLLLRAYHMCGAHKLRRAAKLRSCSRGRHNGRCFTPPDESTGIGVCTRTGFNGQGFAREHRLIEFNRSTSQMYVGGDHTTKR